MRKHWINILSIVIIVASLLSWRFLFPRIYEKIKSDKSSEKTPVAQTAAAESAASRQVSPSTRSKLTFDVLYKDIPDAPVKKKDAKEMYVRARSAIVIDAETGTILHYQDGKKRMAIASLTKVMTAVLAVESIKDLEKEVVTIDQNMLLVEGTVVGCPRSGYCISNRLRTGEKITAMNLLKAMLMNSTNDAAMALGIHIAGSKQSFADMMNKKAEEIGLMDTHFCNPSGLDEDDKPGQCYSSAYDLARISAYSLKHDTIWKTMRLADQDIYSVDGTVSHHVINTDVLLDQMSNCLGGKTGFTYEAGKSLMMAAHDPNNKKHKVVAVLLDDEYRWEDMKNLLDWTFASYEWPEK